MKLIEIDVQLMKKRTIEFIWVTSVDGSIIQRWAAGCIRRKLHHTFQSGQFPAIEKEI